ncbi:glycosyltransferase family protein [Thermodesulfobacteriota bacterium]
MARKSTYNILMYSHDTYGLGHIRRTMAIASQLRAPHINILILTGSPIAGRFVFPEQIDFVRIPGMIKKTNEEYLPLSIKINPEHALKIRTNIITATTKTFQPHLFIVDKEPLGLKKEVLPTLQWLRRSLPGTRSILGLRDIMDEAGATRKEWKEKGVYKTLKALYDEIWVYGIRDFYDPIVEYAIPEELSRKIHFTGYIPRTIPDAGAVRRVREKHGVTDGKKLVVVTAGGGGDGYAVMNTFLSVAESGPGELPFRSLLITGPFMPRREREEIFGRAARLGIQTSIFYNHMEEILAAADLVVTMGGYNTLCEILSLRTVSLIIPREHPRKEQLIRAQVLHSKNLVDYIPWNAFTAETLRDRLFSLLDRPEPYMEAMESFRLTGLERMRERLRFFRESKS